MKLFPFFSLLLLLLSCGGLQAQLSPAVTAWLQNTTETGSYYVQGNSMVIENNILVNCQRVEYSADFVYVTATGIPAYPTGPFLDGNPSQAANQNGIYRFPLDPQLNSGTPIATNGGNVGLFINGVALFDYRDGVGWNPNTSALCGGPGNPPCPGGPMGQTAWRRDAIPAERAGFDCSKGHPAMGNYHHHQNPSAFKLDLEVVSTICNLYDADGLYAIDPNQHSPLIGFAYDGFPIYGAYGYRNGDGSGGIARIKSSYQLRNIIQRTEWADGTDVPDGPPISATYFLGYFREDYAFVPPAADQQDFLDVHNGRFCVTPDYPNGTYAYFATVDENHVSAYPYVIGPTFAGTATNRKVTSVDENTTSYLGDPTAISEAAFRDLSVSVFPNPGSELIAVQLNTLVRADFAVELRDISGRLVAQTGIRRGSTIAYFDVQTVYPGTYFVTLRSGEYVTSRKVVVGK